VTALIRIFFTGGGDPLEAAFKARMLLFASAGEVTGAAGRFGLALTEEEEEEEELEVPGIALGSPGSLLRPLICMSSAKSMKSCSDVLGTSTSPLITKARKGIQAEKREPFSSKRQIL
jgi:hypothetical protein